MIQVGIVGTGFIGPAHIETLRRVRDIEVVALCDNEIWRRRSKKRDGWRWLMLAWSG